MPEIIESKYKFSIFFRIVVGIQRGGSRQDGSFNGRYVRGNYVDRLGYLNLPHSSKIAKES